MAPEEDEHAQQAQAQAQPQAQDTNMDDDAMIIPAEIMQSVQQGEDACVGWNAMT